MVVSSEACCPKCFVENQYSIKLKPNGRNGNGGREFECPYCKSIFAENETGFLEEKNKSVMKIEPVNAEAHNITVL